MQQITIKELLDAGVHFGHQTRRWNPKMKKYIFMERNRIHIIDLQYTLKAMEEAGELVHRVVSSGGTVLFVGTKKQAIDIIEEEARRCGMTASALLRRILQIYLVATQEAEVVHDG